MSKDLLLSEIYNTAADLLDEKGWCQHISYSLDGSMCMYGALAEGYTKAYTRRSLSPTVFWDVWKEACKKVQNTLESDSIPQWNDAEGRTQFEVTNLLRKLAYDASPSEVNDVSSDVLL